jgi:hypothetical protein
LRVLNRVWRLVTFGRSTRIWVDDREYAQLVAAAELADSIEDEIRAQRAENRRMRARLLAYEVTDAAGIPGDRARALVAAVSAAPPLTPDGELDAPGVVEAAETAVAVAAVDEFLADVFA